MGQKTFREPRQSERVRINSTKMTRNARMIALSLPNTLKICFYISPNHQAPHEKFQNVCLSQNTIEWFNRLGAEEFLIRSGGEQICLLATCRAFYELLLPKASLWSNLCSEDEDVAFGVLRWFLLPTINPSPNTLYIAYSYTFECTQNWLRSVESLSVESWNVCVTELEYYKMWFLILL